VNKELDGTSRVDTYLCANLKAVDSGQKSLADTDTNKINVSDIKSIASEKRNASKQLPNLKYLCWIKIMMASQQSD